MTLIDMMAKLDYYTLGIVGIFFILSWIVRYYRSKGIRQLLHKVQAQLAVLQEKSLLNDRKRYGLIAKWLTPDESQSSFCLNLYNDSTSKLFNIEISIPPEYQKIFKYQINNNILDVDKELTIHLLPERNSLQKVWMKNDLAPIEILLSYTESPLRKDSKTLAVPVKISNAPQHFRELIRIKAEKR